MTKGLCTALAILFASTFHANAQSSNQRTATINQLVEMLNNELEENLSSIGRGIEVTNMWLKVNDKEPIYCPPENFVISGKQYGQILKSTIEKNPSVGNFDVQYAGMVLITGLRSSFPCH